MIIETQSNNSMSRFIGWTAVGVIALFSIVSCGGDGGGGSKPDAFNFNESNAIDAASIMVADQNTVAPFSRVILGVIQILGSASPASRNFQPQAVIPIGNLDICASGTFSASWDDADNNLTISNGDKTEFTLTNCDFVGDPQNPVIISGTIDVGYTAVTLTGMTSEVDVDLLIDETYGGESYRESLETSLQMSFSSLDGVNYQFVYTWGDADHILVAHEGTQQMAKKDLPLRYKHGCASINLDLSLANSETYQMDFSGVVNDAQSGVMSFHTTTPLTMVEGSEGTYAESGVVVFTNGGTCKGIDASKGAAGADDSTLTLTAMGGGDVTLDGVDGSGNTFMVQTTWDQLY